MELSQNSFCSAPWFQVRNDNDGRLRACCQIDHTKTQFSGRTDYYLGQDSLTDWLESDYVKYLRKELTQGNAIPECEKCWRKERNGLQSLRDTINHGLTNTTTPGQSWVHFYLKNKTDYSSKLLISADIKLSNICNFSCAMCNPLDSTKIYSIWSKNKTHPMVQYSLSENPGMLDRARSVFVDNKNIDFLREVLNHDLQQLKILGGEPLLDADMLSTLENLDEKKAGKITLQIITNGSVDLSTIRNRLSRFKDVVFIVSLEGLDNIQDYVRRGSNWTYIENNIKKYIDNFSSRFICVNYTLQALTLLGLPNLIKWCGAHEIPLNFGVLDNPRYLSLSSVPTVLKEKAIDLIGNCGSKIIPPGFQNEPYITLPGVIDLIKESDHDPAMTNTLKKFVDWYDPSKLWQEILPEWKPYL